MEDTMTNLDLISSQLRILASELEIQAAQSSPTSAKSITMLHRTEPLVIPHAQWTPVPMTSFYGGDESLVTEDGKYFIGRPGPWQFMAYAKLASNSNGQGIIQFVRDIEGRSPDPTGTNDWNATPGKDFIAHMWAFHPTQGKPTGWEIYQGSGKPLALEYAQLKAIPL